MISQAALLAHQMTLGRHLRINPGAAIPAIGAEPGSEAAADAGQPAQLIELIADPDFAFTRSVRHSWCVGRTNALARLTLSVLPEPAARQLVDDWVARGGGASLDPMSEAEGFFEFAAGYLEDPSHALTICRMEQAALRANCAVLAFVAPDPSRLDQAGAVVGRGSGAALVRFFAPPERLLACVSARQLLPPLAEESVPVLFAPGLAQFCRPATAPEVGVWERLDAPATIATLAREGYPRRLIGSMLEVGAIDPLAGDTEWSGKPVDTPSNASDAMAGDH